MTDRLIIAAWYLGKILGLLLVAVLLVVPLLWLLRL